MKKENHEQAEILLIGGVLILLLACILAEIVRGQEVELGTVITSLALILSSAGGHLFGKKAGVAAPEEKKNEGTTS